MREMRDIHAVFRDEFIDNTEKRLTLSDPSALTWLESTIQLNPAIPKVKGPTNFICYWRIFVIAIIVN